MSEAGYASADVFAVRLALEEATINAIKHGHQGDAGKTVHVCYHVGDDHVFLEIEDEGPGFDPRAVANPLTPENLERCTGRGLLLLRYYMTRVKHNERGNRISLCKSRTK
jgi:serine/threonine-protein kinase RsbW